MKILVNTKDSLTEGSVCGMGSFDGIHRGHQAIIERVKQLAGNQSKSGIITFTPLPFFILKNAPICCLTPNEEKNEILSHMNIDFVYYFEFSHTFAQLGPEGFVQLLARQINPSVVVVGENFHFGHKRAGNAQLFTQLARGAFRVEIMAKVGDDGTISSTRIRELLLLGNVKAANRLLGREYSISGIVTSGKGRGMLLGFPTINIVAPGQKLIPLDGVYKVRVKTNNEDLVGALFCRHELLEVHIIGFNGNLYGQRVTIRFLERIRGVEQFADDKALKAAIAKDITAIGRSIE
jgi:riboflavin kinase/FMN adenylyltransferase